MPHVRSMWCCCALLLAFAPPAHGQHEHHAETRQEKILYPAALRAQLEEVRTVTARCRDHLQAKTEGYRRFGTEGPLMGEHWYRRELAGQPLDLSRPSTLQYAMIDGQRVLVGVAYTLYQRPGEPLPEGFAGDIDRWHNHDITAIAREIVRGADAAASGGAAGAERQARGRGR